MPYWDIPPIWEGGEVWIIGGGTSIIQEFGIPKEIALKVFKRELPPSAYSDYLSPIHDKHVIAVNNAYQLGEWIDVMFFGDCTWYKVHRAKLAQWPNIKTTRCRKFGNKPKEKCENINFLKQTKKIGHGIATEKDTVIWNNNSGATAINLAYHLGVKRIILLGFDMKSTDKITHWHYSHGKYGHKPRRPPYERHMKPFPKIAADAKMLGVEIINASPDSDLTDFRKVSVKELL